MHRLILGTLPRLPRHSFLAPLKCKRFEREVTEGWRKERWEKGVVIRLLRDYLQDVEDQFHDHGALAQLARSAVYDRNQSAVQVAQVLRQERLTVTSCQVTHLQRYTETLLNPKQPGR